jgi:hypothetical protein
MDIRAPVLSYALIDRFLGRVLDAQAAWTAAGEAGLARVPSPTEKARMVTLLWGVRSEADRWAATTRAHPIIKRLPLADLLIEVLPKLCELERLVGPGWGPEPLRPEVEPADLMRRLRKEAVARFVRKASRRETVWILQGADGPVCLMSKRRPSAHMLPCWHDSAHAELRIAGPLADAVATAVPIAAFRDRMLPWLGESGWTVAPGYCEGDGVMELAPDELASRLRGAAPGQATAA